MAEKILVADDEREITELIALYLENEHFTVFQCRTAQEALDCIDKECPDLAILDVMLPDRSGFEICKRIRREYTFPVIMLTAKIAEVDRITGLTLGADDYVTKPFNPVELQARVKSQIRRYMLLGSGQKVRTKLSAGGIELDDKLKEVTLDGEPVNLTRTEYDILKLLMEHPGEVYSPKQIYEAVWKGSPCGVENTVAVHIRHLREKLEYNPAEPRYLKVVWGRGYKMEDVENE